MITVTTDTFCDGEKCVDWTSGVSGRRSDAKEARRIAKRAGWYIGRKGDFCPACVAEGLAKP